MDNFMVNDIYKEERRWSAYDTDELFIIEVKHDDKYIELTGFTFEEVNEKIAKYKKDYGII